MNPGGCVLETPSISGRAAGSRLSVSWSGLEGWGPARRGRVPDGASTSGTSAKARFYQKDLNSPLRADRRGPAPLQQFHGLTVPSLGPPPRGQVVSAKEGATRTTSCALGVPVVARTQESLQRESSLEPAASVSPAFRAAQLSHLTSWS